MTLKNASTDKATVEWPGDERSLENWRNGRNKALRELDLTFARRMLRERPSSDEVLLTALHKARYECLDIDPELRHASGQWLRERGYGRAHGELLPEGELPE